MINSVTVQIICKWNCCDSNLEVRCTI